MSGINTVVPEVMTLSEAANFIRISEKTLGEMARRNQLPCQKAGREWRFLRSALEDWLKGAKDGNDNNKSTANKTDNALENIRVKQTTLFKEAGFRDTAFIGNRNEPLHRWTPWIAGFSSAFVEGVFDSLISVPPKNVTVLDPFAGVGTTLIEGLKYGYNVIGFEINPFAALACRVKLNAFKYDEKYLERQMAVFSKFSKTNISSNKSPKSTPPKGFRSRVPFFSPKVEKQVLLVLDFISNNEKEWIKDIFRLALGSVMVGFSNYSYEPSLGRRQSAGKKDILDADVAKIISDKLKEILEDIILFKEHINSLNYEPPTNFFKRSYLGSNNHLKNKSVDILITSPPYLNNYHYIRNTRPQLYWLGLVKDSNDLKEIEISSFGKFWQTVRSGPEIELEVDIKELKEIINELKNTNKAKGVYGGFGWANYASTYFNDCSRFFKTTTKLLKKGGHVVVVIGNNILQGIEIKTDRFLAQIGEKNGFELIKIHKVRTKRTGSSIVNSSVRAGKASAKVELYESAVELKKI